MNTLITKKARGRPPAFDYDRALDQALHVFWRRGYEGASMAELTEALGINKPSLYAAFGNKEELFRKALARYLAGPAAYVTEALKEKTAYEVVRKLLSGSAEFLTGRDHPGGCLIMQSALSCGPSAEIIREELITLRRQYEQALCQRLEQARANGELLDDNTPAELAKYIVTVHQGMSIQATSGASRDELEAVAQTVLRTLPLHHPAASA